ncbi:proton-conducting transporter membrane subunit [Desulfurobacterium thermolithotrophum]|uniref:proton-conducting transporter transmembrane domain-containing protein n=1 Tax=Desulfurobacterium thermolithotrophum TaxID=64160 RepID=UPI0013D81422|nr:proton-conducting transporter membrane subunit [Desulfurobacterium thermolithotrophum]
MEQVVTFLIILPWILALAVFLSPNHRLRQILTFLSLPVLTYLAYMVWSSDLPYFIKTPHWVELGITVFDYFLLGYFLYQGFKFRSFLVSVLAIAQIFLLTWVLLILPHSTTPSIYVDRLTAFMYLIVATVGSIICIYATKYMEQENVERENRFVAILLWFLGVMNFTASVNNLEWFFALFETTTLASYILIRFRWNEISIKNAIRALWMNQIGGIAILIGILFAVKYYNVYNFTDILKINAAAISMIPLGFLSISALVKGAQMPFHKWLLGAMVAPTPVSAILHSATMVKIAPYLILRISPVIKGTLLAKLLITTTGFVFVAAGLLALTQDNFKRILAYSTISLLGLMMLTASMGSSIAVLASLLLVLFHAVVKALLFLEAGIMEKVFHVKYIEQMRRLIEKAPITVFFIALGFMSMTLVPYGIFIAKWITLEEASKFLSHGAYIASIIFITIGGVILALLYFKVIGVISRKRGEFVSFKPEKLPFLYMITTGTYVLFTILGSLFIAHLSSDFINLVVKDISGEFANVKASGLTLVTPVSQLYGWQIVGAIILLMVVPIFAYFVHFKADKVYEYTCGENIPLNIGTYNFFCVSKIEPFIETTAVALFVLTLVLGGGLV